MNSFLEISQWNEINPLLSVSVILKEVKPLPLMKRLNELAVLNKNTKSTHQDISKIFKSDSEWIKTTKEYENRYLYLLKNLLHF